MKLPDEIKEMYREYTYTYHDLLEMIYELRDRYVRQTNSIPHFIKLPASTWTVVAPPSTEMLSFCFQDANDRGIGMPSQLLCESFRGRAYCAGLMVCFTDEIKSIYDIEVF